MMHRVLVTGANKGIGLAIVKSLLEKEKHLFVFLGCRDLTRGLDAVKSITDENTSFTGRVEALQIDVSDAGSVNQAATSVRARFADCTQTPLTALVNNAGLMIPEYTSDNFSKTVDVNVRGVIRTTEEMMPLLDKENGRIVMISSSAGPSFVAGCSEERKKCMTDPEVSLPQITGLMDECLSISSSNKADGVSDKFSAAGLGEAHSRSGYGLTKALLNMYTVFLARENPNLMVNACTPGFIVTDLAKSFEASMGKTLEEMGGKPPAEGAKTPVWLTTGDNVPSSGWYFGSDSVRSPLDKYRSPGDPAYDGV